LIQLNVHLSFCYMFVYISLYTYPFARLFVRLSHVGILSTPLNISAIFTARRICIARTMQRQHVCPTARHSVYLTLRPSVIRQASRPAHMYFCLLLFCICIPVHLPISITFIRTMSSIYVCVFASICPYIMFTAMCPCVCLPHSSILYIPFVHFYDCLSIYVSLCMSIFMQIYITCTVVCPSVCYIRAPSSQYMSVCLAVHSSKFRQCL